MVDIHFQAKYKCIDHPRFGLVTGVFLSSGKELKKGQEVFINYGYTENSFPHDFPWYWAMKKKADHDILKAKEEKRRSKKKKNREGHWEEITKEKIMISPQTSVPAINTSEIVRNPRMKPTWSANKKISTGRNTKM